ncbi:hypothetical protein [Pseudaquidulcibacter saccharophilus]|uniref:hypothetical protein n=1 Tax=Pseudaquidulcibacter saccharophilus TaxID=2831900 RepID=UPI001EFEF790|nr:hypothetical protein [Pseudaquidulcibacter saccharophilus]
MSEAIEKILDNHDIWEDFVNAQNPHLNDFISIDELLNDSMSAQIMESYQVSKNSLKEIITRLRSKRITK